MLSRGPIAGGTSLYSSVVGLPLEDSRIHPHPSPASRLFSSRAARSAGEKVPELLHLDKITWN